MDEFNFVFFFFLVFTSADQKVEYQRLPQISQRRITVYKAEQHFGKFISPRDNKIIRVFHYEGKKVINFSRDKTPTNRAVCSQTWERIYLLAVDMKSKSKDCRSHQKINFRFSVLEHSALIQTWKTCVITLYL